MSRNPDCSIKGNIGKSYLEKTYHLPGCSEYERTVVELDLGEEWFCAEKEATEAGYRKSEHYMDNFLIVSELHHLLPAILISFFAYRRFRSLKLIGIIFAASFLIDLDHLIDLYLFAGHLKFWQIFGKVDFFAESQKVFVLAHSWELAGILGVWGWLRHRPMVLAIALALAGHLLVDQISYDPQPMSYFLIFRFLNNFSLGSFQGR